MKSWKLPVGFLVAVGFVALAYGLCVVAVDQSEYVIITRFGKTAKLITEPGGPHFKSPVDKVHRIDRRIFVLETEIQQLATGDKIPFVAQAYILWRVEDSPRAVERYFQGLRGLRQNAEDRLAKLLNSIARSVFASREQKNIISLERDSVQIHDMTAEIHAQMNAATRDPARGYGIEIVEVGFSRLGLPEPNTLAVYKTMKSEREMLSAKFRAEGRAEARVRKTQASTYRSQKIEEAKKDAQEIIGRAEAKAVEIYAQAFRQDPEFYRYLRTLEAYEKIIDSKTTVVLDSDSALLQYLNPVSLEIKPPPEPLKEEAQKAFQASQP